MKPCARGATMGTSLEKHHVHIKTREITLTEKYRASELWAGLHALVVIGAEVRPSWNYLH